MGSGAAQRQLDWQVRASPLTRQSEMGLAVFRTSLAVAKENRLVEVRKDLSETVELGASNVVPFVSGRVAEQGRISLFRESTCLFGKVGYDHPFLQGGAHPSTLQGLDVFVGRLCLGRIEPVEHVNPESTEGSAVIFGGPVSTAEARAIYGTGNLSPLAEISLPFSFKYMEYLPEAVASHIEPWELLIDGAATTSVSEALVISVFPMGNADRIVSIAGLHGPGTLAIDLVLKNERLVDRLERETRSFVSWQMVAAVEKIVGGVPLELGEIRIREVTGAAFESLRYGERVRSLRTGHFAGLDLGGWNGKLDLAMHSDRQSNESASTRSRLGMRTGAPNHKEQQHVIAPRSDRTKEILSRFRTIVQTDGVVLYLYEAEDGQWIPAFRALARPLTEEELDEIATRPLGF
jgi:hypothetical protein